MPWGLKHYQSAHDLHFITFSCYHRCPYFAHPDRRNLFVAVLEQTRQKYGFSLSGFVVMPEHVHLLISEPEIANLAMALKALKVSVAKRSDERPFWLERYYDFNVFTDSKRIEKLKYIHRNPVHRGLVEKPGDWIWSSYRGYLNGENCGVEIEPFG